MSDKDDSTEQNYNKFPTEKEFEQRKKKLKKTHSVQYETLKKKEEERIKKYHIEEKAMEEFYKFLASKHSFSDEQKKALASQIYNAFGNSFSFDTRSERDNKDSETEEKTEAIEEIKKYIQEKEKAMQAFYAFLSSENENEPTKPTEEKEKNLASEIYKAFQGKFDFDSRPDGYNEKPEPEKNKEKINKIKNHIEKKERERKEKLARIKEEFLETEKIYLNNLSNLLGAKETVLSIFTKKTEKDSLTSAFELISKILNLTSSNQNFLHLISNLEEHTDHANIVDTAMVEIYSHFSTLFENTISRLLTHEIQNLFIAAYKKKNPSLNSTAEPPNLLSVFIMPVQRVMRYANLLEQLVNNSELLSEEHIKYIEILKSIKSTVDRINGKQRLGEHKENLDELAAHIASAPFNQDEKNNCALMQAKLIDFLKKDPNIRGSFDLLKIYLFPKEKGSTSTLQNKLSNLETKKLQHLVYLINLLPKIKIEVPFEFLKILETRPATVPSNPHKTKSKENDLEENFFKNDGSYHRLLNTLYKQIFQEQIEAKATYEFLENKYPSKKEAINLAASNLKEIESKLQSIQSRINLKAYGIPQSFLTQQEINSIKTKAENLVKITHGEPEKATLKSLPDSPAEVARPAFLTKPNGNADKPAQAAETLAPVVGHPVENSTGDALAAEPEPAPAPAQEPAQKGLAQVGVDNTSQLRARIDTAITFPLPKTEQAQAQAQVPAKTQVQVPEQVPEQAPAPETPAPVVDQPLNAITTGGDTPALTESEMPAQVQAPEPEPAQAATATTLPKEPEQETEPHTETRTPSNNSLFTRVRNMFFSASNSTPLAPAPVPAKKTPQNKNKLLLDNTLKYIQNNFTTKKLTNNLVANKRPSRFPAFLKSKEKPTEISEIQNLLINYLSSASIQASKIEETNDLEKAKKSLLTMLQAFQYVKENLPAEGNSKLNQKFTHLLNEKEKTINKKLLGIRSKDRKNKNKAFNEMIANPIQDPTPQSFIPSIQADLEKLSAALINYGNETFGKASNNFTMPTKEELSSYHTKNKQNSILNENSDLNVGTLIELGYPESGDRDQLIIKIFENDDKIKNTTNKEDIIKLKDIICASIGIKKQLDQVRHLLTNPNDENCAISLFPTLNSLQDSIPEFKNLISNIDKDEIKKLASQTDSILNNLYASIPFDIQKQIIQLKKDEIENNTPRVSKK